MKLKLQNGSIDGQTRQYMPGDPALQRIPHGGAHNNMARNGAPKKLTTPAIAHGQTRQTKPSHGWAHGAPLNDEPLQKNWEGKGNVPIHDGMTVKQVAKPTNMPGKPILDEASRLGAPIGGYKR